MMMLKKHMYIVQGTNVTCRMKYIVKTCKSINNEIIER